MKNLFQVHWILANTFLKILVLFFLLSSFLGCSNSCEELNSSIRPLIEDGTLDSKEWNSIIKFIENNKDEFKDCYGGFFKNSQLDQQKLKDYILKVAHASGRKNISLEFINDKDISKNQPLKFKFYLESSESVHSYEGQQATGEFRAVINRLLNDIDRVQQADNMMFIVNTVVSPYQGSFRDFIQQSRVFNQATKVGDTQKTDFRLIFENILLSLKENEISIMASDLIYSTPQMAKKTIPLIANEVESLTQSVFNSYAKDISIMVVKFNSSFDGKYYFFDPVSQRERSFQYVGRRPFYLTFFASHKTMERFLNDDLYVDIKSVEKYPSFENYHIFQNSTNQKPYYSILIKHPKERASYSLPKIYDSQIKKIEKVRPEKRTDAFELAIGVDLSGYYLSEQFKCDVNNYMITGGKYEIISVNPIGDFKSINSNTATHVILIKAKQNNQLAGKVSIAMKNELSSWINESSTTNDTNANVPGFEKTTFVLKPLLEGIYRAFNREVFFTIELDLNN